MFTTFSPSVFRKIAAAFAVVAGSFALSPGLANAAIVSPGYQISDVMDFNVSPSTVAFDGNVGLFYTTSVGFSGTERIDIRKYNLTTGNDYLWAAGANQTSPGTFSGFANDIDYDPFSETLYMVNDTFSGGVVYAFRDTDFSGDINVTLERTQYLDVTNELPGSIPSSVAHSPLNDAIYITVGDATFAPGVDVYIAADTDADYVSNGVTAAITGAFPNAYGSAGNVLVDPTNTSILYVSATEFTPAFAVDKAFIKRFEDMSGDLSFDDPTDLNTTFAVNGLLGNPAGLMLDGDGDLWAGSSVFLGDNRLIQYKDFDNDGISDAEFDVAAFGVAGIPSAVGPVYIEPNFPAAGFEAYGTTGTSLVLRSGTGIVRVTSAADVQDDIETAVGGQGDVLGFFVFEPYGAQVSLRSADVDVNIIVTTYTGEPPYILGDDHLNRWWTIEVNPPTATVVADVTLTYDEGDVGGDENNYLGAFKLEGTTWVQSPPVAYNPASNTATIGNLSIVGQTHWTIGGQAAFLSVQPVPSLTFFGMLFTLGGFSFLLYRRRKDAVSIDLKS